MYLHPYISSQVAKERQREMLTQAEKQRLVTLAARAAKEARKPAKSTLPMRRFFWRVLRLRLEPQR